MWPSNTRKLKSPTSSVNTAARGVKNCKLKANKLCKKQKISLILGNFADPWPPRFLSDGKWSNRDCRNKRNHYKLILMKWNSHGLSSNFHHASQEDSWFCFFMIRQREYNAQSCSYQAERRTRRLKETGRHMHQKLVIQVKSSKVWKRNGYVHVKY